MFVSLNSFIDEEWRNAASSLFSISLCLFSFHNIHAFYMLLSNSYLVYFTWRVCGPIPLYLHVRSRCVNSWTVGLNLKQPRDTLLIRAWQLYCFRRHNEPPLNVTLWDCPNTISCWHLIAVCRARWYNWFLPACVCVQCFGYLSAFIICETHTVAVLLDKKQHLLPY